MNHHKGTQINLYYGIQESECDANTYHAFEAVDPDACVDKDHMAQKLAAMLDTEPGNDDFQMRSMYVNLPATLVERIQKDAISDYLAKQHITNLFDRTENDHERVFYHITPMSNIQSIYQRGLGVCFGRRAINAKEHCAGVWLITDLEALKNCLTNWASENFGEEEKLAIVRAELPEGFPLHDQHQTPCEKVSAIGIPSKCLSFYAEKGERIYPIARLDYLYRTRSGDSIFSGSEYYSENDFIADLKRELDSGMPLEVVLYRDANGETISRNFMLDLDRIPLRLRVEEALRF